MSSFENTLGNGSVTTFLFSTCLLALISLSGCAPIQDFALIPDDDGEIQQKAERLFINGDLQNALLQYEHIRDTTLSNQQRTRALYGLACTQIILAESDDQLAEGILNLNRWSSEKGTDNVVENRHLLVLALMRQRERLLRQQQERRNKNKIQRRQISHQKKVISRLGETMTNLQNQLKELEALDEHYQEQKRTQ